jgi:two-component system, LuxR family, sensor kinase FixL
MNLNKEEVTVSVMDSGPGIDPGILEKLFKPFVTTRKDGSGIGLALSRSIMERHNGKIWGENIDGGGALFSFRLKILKVENGKRHRLYHR